MGKKAERIEQLEDENYVLERRIRELDDENRALRAGRSPDLDPHVNLPAGRAAEALAVLRRVDDDSEARYLSPVDVAAEGDLQAIRELHRPVATAPKAESALDIVRANNNERASLQDSARRTNAILSRVASALKVPRWDEDGTELLERCQQWATLANWLKARQMLAKGPVADEIGTIRAAVVAPTELARWIMTKTKEMVPACVVEVADAQAAHDGDAVTKSDLVWLERLAGASPTLAHPPANWLSTALKTERGTHELLALINLVLLPLLDRMKVVSDVPVKAN